MAASAAAPMRASETIELGEHFPLLPTSSHIPEMLDEIRERLGTADMPLEEIIVEMRSIRETSNYEAKAKNS